MTLQSKTNKFDSLVPKDLKQFKKLLNCTEMQFSGKGSGLALTVCLINADSSFPCDATLRARGLNHNLFYKLNLLNKRACSLFKPVYNSRFWNSLQIRGCALNVTSFSGNYNIKNNTCYKASKMLLCYQIGQQIYKIRSTPLNPNPLNLLGALVISKNHKWFIDSTELNQSLALQQNFSLPTITLNRLTSASKRKPLQKTIAKCTLILCKTKYAKQFN